MKRHGILNSDISSVLSYMGHTDRICIADCGLPIPEETERIDLAVKFGQPTFMELLKVVGDDMTIEKIVLAEEIKENNISISNISDYKWMEWQANAIAPRILVPTKTLKNNLIKYIICLRKNT